MTLGFYSTFINLYNTLNSSSINLIVSVGMQQSYRNYFFSMITVSFALSFLQIFFKQLGFITAWKVTTASNFWPLDSQQFQFAQSH